MTDVTAPITEEIKLTAGDSTTIVRPPLNPAHITPNRVDGEITLMRYKHPATGAKEYWTSALGFPVDAALDNHWKRAQDAIDSARAQLPEIRLKIEAVKAEENRNTEAALAEIKAKFGDTGPLPDDNTTQMAAMPATAEEAGELEMNFDDPDAPGSRDAVRYSPSDPNPADEPSAYQAGELELDSEEFHRGNTITINAGDVSGTIIGAVLESL